MHERSHEAAHGGSAARRSAAWLAAAFGTVVALFIGSAEYVWHGANDIGVAAASIARNASPSIEHVSAARVAMEGLTVRLHEHLSSPDPSAADSSALEADRRELNAQMNEYLSLEPYPGERARWRELQERLVAFSRTLDGVLGRARHGDVAGAREDAVHVLRDAHDRLAASMSDVVRFDAERARDLAGSIELSRAESRRNLTVVEIVSTLLAVVVGAFALRAKRRYEGALEAHRNAAAARADEQGEFAARVAHDIRSPLATVGLSLDALGGESIDPIAVKAATARARRALARVVRIVDGLLDFARAGARPPPGARTDVAPIVVDLVDELLPTAQEARIQLEVEPVAPVAVACSAGVLTSMIANLLRNAMKYIDGGVRRRITVRALDRGDRVRIEVEDTGPGLPDEIREKIFDPYVRAPGSSQPGIGLGLATVKRLCEGHGGRVGEVPAAGGGSCFWIELPRAAPA